MSNTNSVKLKFENILFLVLREAAKKSSSTNGQAIKALPLPPPTLELNGHWNLFLSLKIAENGF